MGTSNTEGKKHRRAAHQTQAWRVGAACGGQEAQRNSYTTGCEGHSSPRKTATTMPSSSVAPGSLPESARMIQERTQCVHLLPVCVNSAGKAVISDRMPYM